MVAKRQNLVSRGSHSACHFGSNQRDTWTKDGEEKQEAKALPLFLYHRVPGSRIQASLLG